MTTGHDWTSTEGRSKGGNSVKLYTTKQKPTTGVWIGMAGKVREIREYLKKEKTARSERTA